ncbi:MAG: TlpA family protein disulfide reductase [Bacteroidales bacterium]|nr:TlpA family protein disulfide reductase [Bacteroidales bacterium]
MKNFTLTVLIFSFIITTATAQNESGTLTKIGDTVPAFVCTTIDGNTINSKNLEGKVLMINFFATWCPPCVKELPVVEKNIKEKYIDNDDFVLIVIGREHDSNELIEYSRKKEVNLPFAPDIKRDIYSLFAENTIPRNVIIGKDGKISYQSIGYTEKEFKELEKHLAELLK